MSTIEASLMPLILRLGRTSAVTMDVAAVLGSVCSGVTQAVGVAGMVVLLTDPPLLQASDERAAWLGGLQQEAEMGPLPAAVRSGRPMLTADLTRIGPPALAAAAAECGLGSSLALPIERDRDRLGALQLLGDARRPVEMTDGETLRPLLDVLAARLIDVRALSRTAPVLVPSPRHARHDVANACEVTTRSLPVVMPRTAPMSSTTPRSFDPGLVPPPTPQLR